MHDLHLNKLRYFSSQYQLTSVDASLTRLRVNLRPRVDVFKIKLRPFQDHVCQDQVCQDHVCQDHGFQDHVSQDHVIFFQFDPI